MIPTGDGRVMIQGRWEYAGRQMGFGLMVSLMEIQSCRLSGALAGRHAAAEINAACPLSLLIGRGDMTLGDLPPLGRAEE
jgi:hypothetical protein